MIKSGIKSDYDLWANKELKGCEICIVCGKQLRCRWTDYSGEGVCLICGTAYQLKWGSDEQEKEGKYPYCNIKEFFIPILKQYWEEKKTFVFTGRSFRETTGSDEFNKWMDENHPEMAEESK